MIDSARRHGKDVAMLVDTPEDASRWIAAGVKIIVLSSEVAVLHQAYSSMIAELRGAGSADPELEFQRIAVVTDVVSDQTGGPLGVTLRDRCGDALVLGVAPLSPPAHHPARPIRSWRSRSER